MQEHLKLLGFKVRDVVTGFEGVVGSIAFDLYGCVQAVVYAPKNEKGELPDGRYFDTKRLMTISDAPVMAAPTFVVVPGGEAHPVPQSPPVP